METVLGAQLHQQAVGFFKNAHGNAVAAILIAARQDEPRITSGPDVAEIALASNAAALEHLEENK